MSSEQDQPARASGQGSGQSRDAGQDLNQLIQQHIAQAIQPVVADVREQLEEAVHQQVEAERREAQQVPMPGEGVGRERAHPVAENRQQHPVTNSSAPATPQPQLLTGLLEPVLGSVVSTVDAVQDMVGLEVLPSQARRQQLEERIARLEARLAEDSQGVGTEADQDQLEARLEQLEAALEAKTSSRARGGGRS